MKLKELRKKAKLTQQSVADYVGINQNTYYYWESGRTKIDSANLAKLANLFGVSIDYILSESSEQIEQIVPQHLSTNLQEISNIVSEALCQAFSIYPPSDDMTELHNIYNRANDDKRKQLLAYARFLDSTN